LRRPSLPSSLPGGYAVAGRVVPAGRSLAGDAVPIGLAAGIRAVRPIAAGAVVTWSDVEPSPHADVRSMRAAMAAGGA